MSQTRPRGIIIVAMLMIAFGLAEVTTALTHDFFRLSIPKGMTSTYASAVIGVVYAMAGLLILSMRKRAAALAIVLLIADIIGRIAMVVTGLYPVDSFRQTFAIILGTFIVAVFAIYIRLNLSSFR
jgi:uncharacterized membrane protein